MFRGSHLCLRLFSWRYGWACVALARVGLPCVLQELSFRQLPCFWRFLLLMRTSYSFCIVLSETSEWLGRL